MWFGKKQRIFVFGTGSGGINFYTKRRRNYHVLGFVDNNAQKQGQQLFGLPVCGPHDLKQLDFDKIIIASDFASVIYPQLIGLGFVEAKIDIYDVWRGSTLIRRLRNRLWTQLQEIMCRQPGLISDVLYRFYLFWTAKGKKPVERFNLQWLDTTDEFKVHVFRPALPGEVQGPRFVGREVAPVKVTLPEVALHRFRQGQVGSISRSILLPGQRVVIERTTTATPATADYRVGDLVFHGKGLALMAVSEAEHIDKGILVNGGSEGNYYHWVLEILSQLQFIGELPVQYADYPILMSANSQKIPSIKAMIDSFGISRPFIYLATQNKYQVDDLLFITAPNNMIPNAKGTTGNTTESNFARRESIQYLRKSALSLAAGAVTADLPKRVFLARKGFVRRYNQPEVIDLLEPYGFTSVYMEDLDIHQQVSIMANAEVVVGPTGAAWTNIMFASPGAQALCWMAEEYGNLSCFSNLAAIVGVDLEFVCYRTGAHDSYELFYKDYTLDVSIVSAWLKRHLPDPL